MGNVFIKAERMVFRRGVVANDFKGELPVQEASAGNLRVGVADIMHNYFTSASPQNVLEF
jgi:hypothetical protein